MNSVPLSPHMVFQSPGRRIDTTLRPCGAV
jgi:hypothetical protein